MREHAITLDEADIDVLYTLVAGPHSEEVARRLGLGAQSRTFNRLHAQIPRDMAVPTRLRDGIRAEGKWSTALPALSREQQP